MFSIATDNPELTKRSLESEAVFTRSLAAIGFKYSDDLAKLYRFATCDWNEDRENGSFG